MIFESNGGTGQQTSVSTSTDAVVVLPESDLLKTGYTFDSWNTKADGLGDKYSAAVSFIVPASNTAVKLYAIWTPKQIIVNFNGNGNNSGETSAVDSKSDESITLPVCGYLKTGYSFVGWSTNLGEKLLRQVKNLLYPQPTPEPLSCLQTGN